MRFDLIEEWLHEQAIAQTGWSDFGDRQYRAGLRRFLEALASDGGLDASEVRAQALRPVLRGLIGRLYSERGRHEVVDSVKVPIVAPLFVVGLPRSGTTALHQLLSVDPQFQGLEHWLVEAPMVRPPREQWARYPTYRAASARSEALAADFRTVHWMAPDEYDECILVHLQCFASNHLGSQRNVPSYDAWFLREDPLPGIRRLADNYRLIGARTSPSRTWLLKNPSHLFNLDAILETFPDARIVLTHRDPLKTIPSVCNLLHAMRVKEGRETDERAKIGLREMNMWGVAVERMEAARRRHPEAFHDVFHAELVRDAIGVARRIYARFDLELTPSTQAGMRQWMKDVAPTRQGAQHYAAADFRLSEEQIADRFRSYRAAYALAS